MLLLLLGIMIPLTSLAYDVEVDGIYYNLDAESKQASITTGEVGYAGSIIIPSKITLDEVEYAVVAIEAEAFKDCTSLTSIAIPRCLTSFGDRAFSGCTSLTSICCLHSNWAEVPTLGTDAFSNISQDAVLYYRSTYILTNILANLLPFFDEEHRKEIATSYTAENGVTYSLDYEFAASVSGSSGVSGDVTVPSTINANGGFTYTVKQIGDYAFSNNTSMTSIDLPSTIITIGYKAFNGCTGLTSVTLPNSVTGISSGVFGGCSNLTHLDLGNSVEYVGQEIISGAPLSSITLPHSLTSIDWGAFTDCPELTSLVIPSSVTDIGNGIIRNCPKLVSLVVEDSNTKYDSRNNCNAIIETSSNMLVAGCSKTVIPDGITSIRTESFMKCGGLTSIDIPNSVQSIGSGAFVFCPDLTSVTIGDGVTAIEDNTFSTCPKLETLTLGSRVESIGRNAFKECSSLASLDIPNSVKSIGEEAFSYCSKLSSITIGNNVETIEIQAFSNCTSLVSVNILAKTTGHAAFYKCSNLSHVTLSDNVENLGDMAFGYCTSLTEISIPRSVTSMSQAFLYCTSLVSTNIPKSVTNIYNAFNGCTSLKTLVCELESLDGVFTGDYLFKNVPLNEVTLYVPASSIDMYKTTSPWSGFGTIETLRENISISDLGAATYCSNFDLDFTGKEDIKAYVASGYDYETGAVLLTRAYKIPTGTGFMVTGNKGDYSIPTAVVTYAYANLFVGTTAETTLPGSEGGYSNYILADGDDGLMFYLSDGSDPLAAHKAYLHIPTNTMSESRTLSLSFADDSEVTGIEDVVDSGNAEQAPAYNLNGQRVDAPKNGVFVRNGKIVIMK